MRRTRRNQYARWSGPRVPHERRAELTRTSCTRRVQNPTHRDNLCRGRWLCPGTPVCPKGHCQLNASHHDPATKFRNTPKPPWQLGYWNTKAGARKTNDFCTPSIALTMPYGQVFRRRVRAMGIRDRPTAPRSPWQNPYVERLVGSIRRECLDHLIIFGEAHLRRVLRAYSDYYNRSRTHLSLDKDTPLSRPILKEGRIRSIPHMGGLHHSFVRM